MDWTVPSCFGEILQNAYKSSGPKLLPKSDLILRAFQECRPENLKVVILGQDPYSDGEKACGLAFAQSERSCYKTDSLYNICKEARCSPGDLFSWPAQGVLMLNTALTVEEGRPGAHMKLWKPFTEAIVAQLFMRLMFEETKPFVWLLMGLPAQQAVLRNKKLRNCVIQGDNTAYICTSHPSPLSASRGFLSSGAFDLINEELERLGQSPINWGK